MLWFGLVWIALPCPGDGGGPSVHVHLYFLSRSIDTGVILERTRSPKKNKKTERQKERDGIYRAAPVQCTMLYTHIHTYTHTACPFGAPSFPVFFFLFPLYSILAALPYPRPFRPYPSQMPSQRLLHQWGLSLPPPPPLVQSVRAVRQKEHDPKMWLAYANLIDVMGDGDDDVVITVASRYEWVVDTTCSELRERERKKRKSWINDNATVCSHTPHPHPSPPKRETIIDS